MIVAGGLVVLADVRPAPEIVHQVRHEVRGSCLARESKIFARQHVPIKSHSKFHQIRNSVAIAGEPRDGSNSQLFTG